MDLRYSDSDEAFRKELRAWLVEAVPAHGSPPDAADWPGRRSYDTSWQRKLYDAGYAGVNWPKEYGGRDASLPAGHVCHLAEGTDEEVEGGQLRALLLGGSEAEDTSLAKITGPGFDEAGIVDAGETAADVYLREREDGERFLDTYRRIGMAPFKEALYG